MLIDIDSGTLVTFGVLWLFLTALWVGLQCVVVVFPDHTHLIFSYSSIILIKIQQKSVIEVRGGGGVFMPSIPRT